MFPCCTYKYLVYPQLANHTPDCTEIHKFYNSTAVDMVSLHALDSREPRKRKQIGFFICADCQRGIECF